MKQSSIRVGDEVRIPATVVSIERNLDGTDTVTFETIESWSAHPEPVKRFSIRSREFITRSDR